MAEASSSSARVDTTMVVERRVKVLSMKWLAFLLLLLVGPSSAQLRCPLSLLIPFRDGRRINSVYIDSSDSSRGASVVTADDHQRDGLSLLAMALMAIEDLNKRNSTLIPDMNITSCNIAYPTPTLLDSGRNAENITRNGNIWLTDSSCAVIGPADNFAAQQVGTMLIGRIVPALSYAATAPILTNAAFYPNMALGRVQWRDTIMALAEYLHATSLFRLGVLYEPGENLDFYDYLLVWEDTIEVIGLDVLMSITTSRTKEAYLERLKVIKDKNMRTIVVALNRDDNLIQMAEAADELGMLTEDHVWIFMDSFLLPQYAPKANQLESDSVTKLLKRTRIFHLLDGLVPINKKANITGTMGISHKFDEFQSEWVSRGSGMVNEMNSLLEKSVGLGSVVVEDDFFEKNVPAYGAAAVYDAVMATGMTACQNQAILDANFNGASVGTYQFSNRSVTASTFVHGIFELDEDDNFQPILMDSNADGEWTKVEPKTEPVIDNYLSTSVIIIGMSLASLAIVFCMVSFVFLFYFRKDRIVSVSQPEFMYMICFGAGLSAMAIYFISFDDAQLEDSTLDTFCVLQLWFSRLGILIVYCAIFSKMWRVERVTQMRRGQRIEVKHVLGPFAAMMVACVGLLIAWTIADTPTWERIYYDGEKFPKGEGTVGLCNENLGFALSIDAIIVVAVSVSLWMSCKTRHLPEDISDSARVHQTLTAHLVLQIINVVFMTFSFLYRKTNLLYMARAAYLFLTTISSIAFLVCPKMYYVWRKQKTGELPPGLQRGKVRVTGIGGSVIPKQNFSHTNNPRSRFTVNQANGRPSASSGLTGTSSTRTGTESFPHSSVTSIAMLRNSVKSQASKYTSTQGLDGSHVSNVDSNTNVSQLDSNTNVSQLDSNTNASSVEKASSIDMNASMASGLDMDRSSIISNDLNNSTRSILKSPTPGLKTSVSQSVSFAGGMDGGNLPEHTTPMPINEERSEQFSLLHFPSENEYVSGEIYNA